VEVTVTETPEGFTRLLAGLDSIADASFLEEIASECAGEIEGLIQRGFQTATDPYGQVWAPRKLAAGRTTPPNFPLDRTGEMKGSFHVEPSAQGVRVENPVIYSPFINYGTRFMDARAMLPTEDGLGEWERPLTDAAQRVFNSQLNQAA
jgi:hypothetical protein